MRYPAVAPRDANVISLIATPCQFLFQMGVGWGVDIVVSTVKIIQRMTGWTSDPQHGTFQQN